MQKIFSATCIVLLSLAPLLSAAQTHSFQQLTFTAGNGQFGKMYASQAVKPALGYRGRFNWGFYTMPHLFIDFGISFSSVGQSYQYLDYSTAAVKTGRQKLNIFSHMLGIGAGVSNRKIHLYAGAHAMLNIMFSGDNTYYTHRVLFEI